MTEIPLLAADQHDFAAAFLDACQTVGFVAVTGHGIPATQFDDVRSMVRRLFDIDAATKRSLMIEPDNYRGFIPLGFFTPNRAESSGEKPDQYEGFKLHWECPANHPARQRSHLYGPNRWAPHVPEMASTIASYWTACDRFADRLLTIIADDLGVGVDVFRSWHEAPLTNMTLLHYPTQPPAAEAMGIHPHKDTNVITFLHPDPVGGLEVRAQDGSWIDATPPADALLINTGEMLELWSGGRYPATPHRVINRTGSERYSFPWFLVPSYDVVVEPLVPCQPGYDAAPMPVGPLSAEVWRTNWPDEAPSNAGFDLGSLDR